MNVIVIFSFSKITFRGIEKVEARIQCAETEIRYKKMT